MGFSRAAGAFVFIFMLVQIAISCQLTADKWKRFRDIYGVLEKMFKLKSSHCGKIKNLFKFLI